MLFNVVKKVLPFSIEATGTLGIVGGIRDLACGSGFNGFLKMGAGMFNLHLVNATQRLYQSALAAGVLSFVYEGAKQAYRGIQKARTWEVIKGSAKGAVGALGIYHLFRSNARVSILLAQIIPIAGFSAIVARNGILKIREGKKLEGLCETAMGIAGIAASIWCATENMGEYVDYVEYMLTNGKHEANPSIPEGCPVVVMPSRYEIPQESCPPVARVNMPCQQCGMFSNHWYMLNVFDRYDKGEFSGVEIAFNGRGLYYNPTPPFDRENWWYNYYCPIQAVDPNCPNAERQWFTVEDYETMCDQAKQLPPARVQELVECYFIQRPEIKQTITQVSESFKDRPVIAVHHRATDKVDCDNRPCQAKRVPYNQMTSEVTLQINRFSPSQKNLSVFVAADEEGMVKRLQELFPKLVVTSPSERSVDGKPLHINSKNPYEAGKSAIVDAHLLATNRTVSLIKTDSQLSEYSSRLLPAGAKIVEVRAKSWRDNLRKPSGKR